MGVKQVIVIRKDLKCRRGKEIAQGAHASMAFLTDMVRHGPCSLSNSQEWVAEVAPSRVEWAWMQGSFRKIVVTVDSEQELRDLKKKAEDAGIKAYLIEDSGLTEFHGVVTPTALGLGPDLDEKLDPITGNLRLY